VLARTFSRVFRDPWSLDRAADAPETATAGEG
jgi:hypothetical protein